MSVSEKIEKMISELEETRVAAAKIDENAYGWKSACARVRKVLQETVVTSKQLRKEIQEKKNG